MYGKESEPGPNDHNIAQDYTAIGSACDQVRVMVYDYATSEPGPVTPADWAANVTAWAVTQMPARKVILGIVLLGYDWPAGGEGQTVSYEQVMAIARTVRRWNTGNPVAPPPSPTWTRTTANTRSGSKTP